MNKNLLIITLAILFIWSGTDFAANVGEKSPDFVLKTIDGTEFRSEEIKDRKPLFLVFWATWCPVCKKEIPKVKDIHAAFQPKGLDVLAINVGVNDSLAKTKRYANKYKMSYPVSFDEGSKVTKSFKVQGTPTVIIVDRRGIVRYRSAEIPDDLEKHYEDLIK
ncbi:MAG: TlpA family protein disulfide reductase [Desulfobacterales bacterium]|nr:TlpA family protein disulfide reductase [Desulfobacterales bacterium]